VATLMEKKSLHAAERDTERVQHAREDYQTLLQPLISSAANSSTSRASTWP
jgi:hypothetical protein